MLFGITAFATFSLVAGERASDHCRCFVTLPLSYLIDQSKLLFWKKIHVSDDVILYTLSRMVCHRFMALGSTYGVTSWNQSVSEIKSAIWCTFIRDIIL